MTMTAFKIPLHVAVNNVAKIAHLRNVSSINSYVGPPYSRSERTLAALHAVSWWVTLRERRTDGRQIVTLLFFARRVHVKVIRGLEPIWLRPGNRRTCRHRRLSFVTAPISINVTRSRTAVSYLWSRVGTGGNGPTDSSGQKRRRRGEATRSSRTARRPCPAGARRRCSCSRRSRASRWRKRVAASSRDLRRPPKRPSRRCRSPSAAGGRRASERTAGSRGTDSRRRSSMPSSGAERWRSPSRTTRSRRRAGSGSSASRRCARRSPGWGCVSTSSWSAAAPGSPGTASAAENTQTVSTPRVWWLFITGQLPMQCIHWLV